MSKPPNISINCTLSIDIPEQLITQITEVVLHAIQNSTTNEQHEPTPKNSPNSFGDLPDFLSVMQVAEYLNVSRNTVYTWTNTGAIPSIKAGNTRRIRKESLIEWVLEKERTS